MPPRVEKQRPPSTRTPKTTSAGDNGEAGSVLERVSGLRASKVNRLKFSGYGLPKTGKSRFGGTLPKPLLVVGTEDGTASIAGTKGVDFVLLRHTSELPELLEGPIKAGKYASVMVDHATGLRNMRIDELWLERGAPATPEKKPFIYAGNEWKDVWVQASKDMRNLLGPLLNLANVMDLNVYVVAHEQNLQEEGGGSSELIKPAIGSALGKSLCAWLNGECDYIGQFFIRRGVKSVTHKVGKITSTKQVPTGKMEYCLRIGPHETYITGFRVPLGRPDPPDVIVDPSYDKIVSIIQG